MKTTWAKAEYMRGGDFTARYRELYRSIQAPYAEELSKAGFFRRFFLHYLITREYHKKMHRLVECNIPSKRSKSEIMIGLMGSSGFLLLIGAAPVGITLGLDSYYKLDLEIRESVILSAEMMLLMALTGGILYGLCLHLTKRRRRKAVDGPRNPRSS